MLKWLENRLYQNKFNPTLFLLYHNILIFNILRCSFFFSLQSIDENSFNLNWSDILSKIHGINLVLIIVFLVIIILGVKMFILWKRTERGAEMHYEYGMDAVTSLLSLIAIVIAIWNRILS